MELDKDIAIFVAEEIEGLTDIPVTLTKPDGEILTDRDRSNVGSVSPDAAHAAWKAVPVKLERDNPPFRNGVALPILFRGEKAGAVLLSGKEKQIEPQLGILMFAIETLMERYLNASQGKYRQRLIEDWITNLFSADYADFDELQETASDLGIRTGQSAAIAVLDIHRIRKFGGMGLPMATTDTDFIQNFILHNLRPNITTNFCSYLGRNTYAMSISTNSFITSLDYKFKLDEIIGALKDLDKRLGTINLTCSAGLGTPGNTLRAYRESFLEAKESLGMSMRSGDPDLQIMYVNDWGLRFFVNGISKDNVRSFMKQNPSMSLGYKAEMGATLEAFFEENWSLQKAADRLNIHKNTLIYRLKKIKDTLGLDPQNFDDAVQLHLFELMRKSHPEYVADVLKDTQDKL